MELRKIEAFCKVVELGGFTRAAEAMLLSQPTISEHVRSLESELDQKLLDRLGREVEPTPAGRLFYRHGKKILVATNRAVEAIEQFSGRIAGRLMIGCSTIPGTYILPELIGRFHGLYPPIKTTLRITGSQFVAKEVLTGEMELGVVGARWNERGLEWSEIFADELALAVHARHAWIRKKNVSLQEVVKEPFIMREPESGTRKVFAKILQENGFSENALHEVAEIGSTAAVKEAIKAGIGISILSRRSLKDEIACGSLVAISIKGVNLYRHFYLIHRRNRELSPVAMVFLGYLRENAVMPVLGKGSSLTGIHTDV